MPEFISHLDSPLSQRRLHALQLSQAGGTTEWAFLLPSHVVAACAAMLRQHFRKQRPYRYCNGCALRAGRTWESSHRSRRCCSRRAGSGGSAH